MSAFQSFQSPDNQQLDWIDRQTDRQTDRQSDVVPDHRQSLALLLTSVFANGQPSADTANPSWIQKGNSILHHIL